jgi:hypothetical protein
MKKIAIIFAIIALLFAVLYFKEKLSYPVTMKVCGLGHVDCQDVARFKTRDDCETTNQMWGWYCDQTDKSNIKCQEKPSTISTGYCD